MAARISFCSFFKREMEAVNSSDSNTGTVTAPEELATSGAAAMAADAGLAATLVAAAVGSTAPAAAGPSSLADMVQEGQFVRCPVIPEPKSYVSGRAMAEHGLLALVGILPAHDVDCVVEQLRVP